MQRPHVAGRWNQPAKQKRKAVEKMIQPRPKGNVVGLRGSVENKRGNIEEFAEYYDKNFLLPIILRGCLRRPTRGRWIPVGSHSLRSVRPQRENISNRGRMERSDHETITRRGVAARWRHPLNDNINRKPSFMRFIEYCNKNILSHLTLKRYLR
jgi:hypothetical protein